MCLVTILRGSRKFGANSASIAVPFQDDAFDFQFYFRLVSV